MAIKKRAASAQEPAAESQIQIVVFHTTTRVIRRLTVDKAAELAADESSIEIAGRIDLAPDEKTGTRYWKLDEKNEQVAATPDEIDAAMVDPALEARKKNQDKSLLLAQAEIVIADPLVPESLRTWFIYYLKLAN